MYGWGQNEELLGRALRGKRDGVVLATKFGNLRKPDGTAGVNGRPEYVPQACEASLKRLGVDSIDLYYQHRVDPGVPIEDTVGAMARVVEQGKVRYLGPSAASPATVRRARAVHPITALQSEFSLLYRVEAEETLPVLRELGISFVAYSPLGRSLLTGSTRTAAEIPADDRRRDHPRFQDENLQKNLDLLKPLLDMAKQKGCTPGQLALAWLLARGRDIVPIPGTKRKARLDENAAAAAVPITPAEVAALQDAAPAGAAAGTRYPGPAMKSVYIWAGAGARADRARERRPRPAGPAGFGEGARAAAKPAELDGSGGAALSHYIPPFPAANSPATASFGMPPAYMRGEHRGFSTFEFQLELGAPLRAGDLVRVRSGVLHVGSSSLRLLHVMTREPGDEVVASLEQSGVHFDQDARRPAPLPPPLRERALGLLLSTP